MKKVVIGCLSVFLLLAIAGTAVTYLFVIKPGMEMMSEFAELGREFEQANRNIDNTASFTAPADMQLDRLQFERYLAAQRSIKTQLSDRLQELNQKYQALDDAQNAGDQPGLQIIFGSYADFGNLLLEAKQAQVDALNAQNFSLEEYNWTRNQVYRAIGQPVGLFAIGEDFSIEQMISNQTEAEREQTVPQSNLELVEPYREELMEMVALAWWGL